LEELLKIEKQKKYLSHIRSHPKKRHKKQKKRHFMNSDRFYFCVPTSGGAKGGLEGAELPQKSFEPPPDF
jgi:hypothetical protein